MAEISASRARTIIRKTMAKGAEMGLKPLSRRFGHWWPRQSI